jgi:hypothetical protein
MNKGIQFLSFVTIVVLSGNALVECKSATSRSIAIVQDSGSTNFQGYRMVIKPSGQVSTGPNGRGRNPSRYPTSGGPYNVSLDLVKRFFTDLESLMPISELPAGGCAKSRSFGSVTTITYQGQTSPDIQCGSAKILFDDFSAIARAMSVQKQQQK